MVRTLHKISGFSTEPFFSEIYFGNRYRRELITGGETPPELAGEEAWGKDMGEG
jgi:hypothetical protein